MLSSTDQPFPPVNLPDEAIQRRWQDGWARNDVTPRPASDVVWETDADLRLISWRNPALPDDCAAGNKPPGCTVFELLARDPANERAIDAHRLDLLARKPFRGFVHRAKRPGGGLMWLESDGDPLYSSDGVFLGYRGITRNVTTRNIHDATAAFLGDLDSLTGLFNRAAFHKRLAQSLAERKSGMLLAVLFIDLDGFKLINDSMGHPVGDELLRSIGERLTHCIRHSDTVARVDGDEFGVIQVDLANVEEATVLAERILKTIHCPYEVCGHRIIPRATIGIAVAPVNGADAEQLVKNADIAQYRAKLENTGSWRFYEPEMGLRVQQRRTLETELRTALERNEFELYYQPFYNIVAQNTCAFEALVRWRHPVRGLVPPDQFIGLAEETGLIVPLGAWVLREACREAAKWPEHVSVSVNLSPVQFRGNSPVEDVREALRSSGLAASRLELEITETVLMHDSDDVFAALHQLRAFGCRIAMDDFGMGYSSLSYLRSFPFDKIKIDRSFIQDLDYRRRGVEIVRAIASLGNSLQLATTAEGVETQEQYSIVCAEGCTEVQGFLFSEPRPACDVEEMMRNVPEEVRFSLPDSVAAPEPPAQNFFIDIAPDSNVFCGEAI